MYTSLPSPTSIPIPIPVKKYTSASTYACACASSPPSPPSKYILLQGGPFYNKNTVTEILSNSILLSTAARTPFSPTLEIEKDRIFNFITEVDEKKEAVLEIDELFADTVCRNLVENGLLAAVIWDDSGAPL